MVCIKSKINLEFFMVAGFAFMLLGTSNAMASGTIKQPAGWKVQYIDASCIAQTDTAGAEDNPQWHIKMGYIAGSKDFFMFSTSNPALRDVKIPAATKAWFVVDGKNFEALSLSNQLGELVLPVENGLKLQEALSSAKTVGIKIYSKKSAKQIEIASFDLENISGAMKWLNTCSVSGIKALNMKSNKGDGSH